MNHDDTMMDLPVQAFFLLDDEEETEPNLLAEAVNAEANYAYEETYDEIPSDR